MEFYHVARNRCPRYAIGNFIKTLCDIHGLPFRPYMSVMFSAALDAYLAMRATIAICVAKAVGHDGPDHRLKNTCPACMYRLEGEPDLGLDLLFTMDGNDSLKRVRRLVGVDDPEAGIVAASREREDERKITDDYYLSRPEVDKWANVEAEDLPTDDTTSSPCESRWENMKPDSRKITWGMFDETGIFLSLCEHGLVLFIVDMVRSGEASKYFLATVEKLLMVFDGRLGGGYDIGCKSIKTLDRSILAELAKENGYRSLVGAFHGHRHGRQCQLHYLTTYTSNIGLADLENCERWFSKSNNLAGSTRHDSPYHRQQAIVEYARHTDNFDVYPALAKYLFDNYQQALKILEDGPKRLAQLLDAVKQRFPDADTRPTAVRSWLGQEREYFQNLKNEPEPDTMEIEYHQALLKLEASEVARDKLRDTWSLLTSADFQQPLSDRTRILETSRRHVNELYEHHAAAVFALEAKIPEFNPRWVPNDPQRIAAAEKLTLREYRRCLDKLESLVVARLSELSKMNKSQTGYQMRKHIAHALKSRSGAINTAVSRFNAAARAIHRDELDFDQVIQFTFLAEFDLLRETRADVRDQPWASPSGREAMDLHYRMERAKEEIQRINVQARRLATYIRDRGVDLRARESSIRLEDVALAHQVQLYCNVRGRATSVLNAKLQDLTRLRGFSGTIVPGIRRHDSTPESPSPTDVMDVDNPLPTPLSSTLPASLSAEMTQAEEDAEAEEEDIEDVIDFCRALEVMELD